VTHYCYRCYAENPLPDDACVACGQPVAAPRGTSYTQQLIWALRHPVSETARLAASILGVRREVAAAAAPEALVAESDDPYLVAEAVRALASIEGERARPLLERLVREGGVIVRRAAAEALAR